MNTLHIKVVPTSEAVMAVRRQLAALDAGIPVDPGRPTLSVPDFETLVSLLTPKRVELIDMLRRVGAASIRTLSKALERDYKNVHGDTVALIEAGLVERDDAGLVETPWDRIEIEVPVGDARPVPRAAA